LQLAVLTAGSIASRCFPGAVRVSLDPKTAEAPLLLWPSLSLTIGQTLDDLLGPTARTDRADQPPTARTLIFGNAPTETAALRVTFDGWIAKVGPAHSTDRLLEREYFSVAGVLAASLALSELFLSFAQIDIRAMRRTVGISLWRPDLDIGDPAALGIPVEYLPRDLWILGLGHLGNAYLWSLATLPYREPGAAEFILNDFDRIEPENIETGITFSTDDLGRLKPRACSQWLEKRAFKTRLIERRFDRNFRRHEKEPGLALCGFDSNPARRALAGAQFFRVIESGLGGTASNFDTISLHTLPNVRTPAELWPDLSVEEAAKRAEHHTRVANDNPAYTPLGGDECGRYDLAGKAVAVPFVGATAASLVVAESIRMFHDGPAYADIKLSLGSLETRFARMTRYYAVDDLKELTFAEVKNRET
jgi:hypothetical protein